MARWAVGVLAALLSGCVIPGCGEQYSSLVWNQPDLYDVLPIQDEGGFEANAQNYSYLGGARISDLDAAWGDYEVTEIRHALAWTDNPPGRILLLTRPWRLFASFDGEPSLELLRIEFRDFGARTLCDWPTSGTSWEKAFMASGKSSGGGKRFSVNVTGVACFEATFHELGGLAAAQGNGDEQSWGSWAINVKRGEKSFARYEGATRMHLTVDATGEAWFTLTQHDDHRFAETEVRDQADDALKRLGVNGPPPAATYRLTHSTC